MDFRELVWSVVGLLLTVMVLSYLIGDNFLFRLAAYLFIGVTSGFLSVLISSQILWPYLVQPLITGSWGQKLWIAIPMVLTLLLVISQFQRFAAAGRIPLAFLAGITAAITIGGAVFGTIIPQMRTVVNAFDPVGWYEAPGLPWLRILDAALMLIGVVGTLSYFLFGHWRQGGSDPGEVSGPRIVKALSKIGQVFIGIALGAVFAGIFSTALVAMIDRLIFIGEFVTRLAGGR